MRINHNISALNTYSRLASANAAQGKSLEKLSSGQRINRAGDDAAGLAISEKMRSQIKGLDQAGRNAQDGISMIQTAEGALSETHSILQRMRELAVQAANDTNTTADRDQIQKEVNQLSSEINRISGTTEFNKQKLLDGNLAADSVSGAKVQVQTAGQNATKAVFEMTFDAFDTAATGACSVQVGVAGTEVCVTGTACTLAGRVAEIAKAINANTTAAACFTATSVGNKLILTANTDNTYDAACVNGCTKIIQLCDAANTCVQASPLVQSVRAVCATKSTNYLSFTDASVTEGTRIDIGSTSVVLWDSSKGNFSCADDVRTKLNLNACTILYDIHQCAKTISATDLMGCLACSATLFAQSTALNGTACMAYDTTNKRICIEAVCAGSQSNVSTATKVYGLAGTTATSGNGTTLQIGANSDQTFKAFFSNMSGKAINVTSNMAGQSLKTSDGKTAYFSGQTNVEKDGATTEYSLDLSSAKNATAAISAIDDSITAVSSERAKLGAYQNRLEHTINNLSTSSENLTAAESRIRDVDMAKEMMEFNKNNILNQAATAMLAQANQQPQGVLQLLR